MISRSLGDHTENNIFFHIPCRTQLIFPYFVCTCMHIHIPPSSPMPTLFLPVLKQNIWVKISLSPPPQKKNEMSVPLYTYSTLIMHWYLVIDSCHSKMHLISNKINKIQDFIYMNLTLIFSCYDFRGMCSWVEFSTVL